MFDYFVSDSRVRLTTNFRLYFVQNFAPTTFFCTKYFFLYFLKKATIISLLLVLSHVLENCIAQYRKPLIWSPFVTSHRFRVSVIVPFSPIYFFDAALLSVCYSLCRETVNRFMYNLEWAIETFFAPIQRANEYSASCNGGSFW